MLQICPALLGFPWLNINVAWFMCHSGEFLAEVQGAHELEVKALEWAPVPVKTGTGMRELLATTAADKKLKLWKSRASLPRWSALTSTSSTWPGTHQFSDMARSWPALGFCLPPAAVCSHHFASISH